VYGSPEWAALPEGDPVRLEAMRVAADAWLAAAPLLAGAAEVIVALDDELRGRSAEQVERRRQTKAAADRTVDQAVERLLVKPAQARPMVQTEDWPAIAVPTPPAAPAPRLRGLPSVSAMIRAVS
jgi:hypothetical protein